MSEIQIHCLYDALVDPRELVAHPDNANEHPDDQIERLGEILEYQGWRYAIKVSKQSGLITTGHGRRLAAILKKQKVVPVVYQDYEDMDQELADVHADNAIASWATLNLSRVNASIEKLGPGFNLDMLGIKDFLLEPADKGDLEEADDLYTKKITAPIYEPKGENPFVSELYDLTKTRALLAEIEASEAPEEVKEFLRLAASRHTVFNYEKVAEFYAHAPAELQVLFEKSALVIIDFEKAIENGFVVLTTEMAEAYSSAND